MNDDGKLLFNEVSDILNREIPYPEFLTEGGEALQKLTDIFFPKHRLTSVLYNPKLFGKSTSIGGLVRIPVPPHLHKFEQVFTIAHHWVLWHRWRRFRIEPREATFGVLREIIAAALLGILYRDVQVVQFYFAWTSDVVDASELKGAERFRYLVSQMLASNAEYVWTDDPKEALLMKAVGSITDNGQLDTDTFDGNRQAYRDILYSGPKEP